jgi:hypothetical protein
MTQSKKAPQQPDDETIILRVQGSDLKLKPPFTNRELHILKQVAGVRAGELFDALSVGDNDVIVALAHIAVLRSPQNRPTLDELWDLPAGEIAIDMPDEADAEAGPTEAA